MRTVQHVIAGLTALSALLLLGLTAAFVVNRGHILERKRRLRQIIDLVPSMIFAKDRDGRFLLANKAVAEAYGTTPEALIHASHQDIHEHAVETVIPGPSSPSSIEDRLAPALAMMRGTANGVIRVRPSRYRERKRSS